MNNFKQYIVSGFREMGSIWFLELKRIFTDKGVMLLFFGATLVYPLLYSISYNPEVLRETAIAVVDLSNTQRSRELTRALDATEQIHVKTSPLSLDEATKQFYTGDIHGVVVIPSDYGKNIATGAQAVVALYADASYMLIYKQVLQGTISATQELGKEIKVERFQMQGAHPNQSENLAAPVDFVSEPLYNQTSGYGSYAMPGLIILILQQSLLMGIGMLGGSERERGLRGYLKVLSRLNGGTVRLIFGRSLAYLTIYIPVSFYLLVLVMRWFNFPHWGNTVNVFLFTIPFLLSCIFLGMLLSTFFKSREQSMLTLLFTSVPLLFLSGFSWPVEAFPWGFEALSQLFPSTPGIKGIIKVCVMGTPLSAAGKELMSLWVMAAVFFFANWIILQRTYTRNLRVIELMRRGR